jgi:hypothetical protein
MHGLNLRYFPIYFSAVIISIIFSLWSGISGSVINTDGICYLQSAESLSQGLNAAVNACTQAKWPFYSILIAGLVSIFHFSYVFSAYLIDGFFSIFTVVIFVKIVLWLSQSVEQNVDSKKQQSLLWFAAIVILLSNEFNSVKYYIIRDHGFWAFYLLSLYFLLHFFRDHRWQYAIAWCVSLIVATLFRIEGAVFLILLPFLTLLNSSLPFSSRIVSFFKMNALLILMGMGLTLWVFIASPNNLGRLSELPLQFTHGFSQLAFDYKMRADHLSEYVLSHFAARYSAWILLLTLIIWYVISVIKNISFIYSIFAVFAWSKKILKASQATHLVLWGYLFINVIITALFLAEHMFLSKRYLIALSLIVMIWVPFALQYLAMKWERQKWPLMLVVMLMVVSASGGIFEFGHSKKYIHDAGTWLAKNTPVDSRVFSNDILVMYYSHRYGKDLFANEKHFRNINIINNGKWKQYQYLALRIDKKDLNISMPLIQEINEQPVKIFANKRGDQVRIYKSTL